MVSHIIIIFLIIVSLDEGNGNSIRNLLSPEKWFPLFSNGCGVNHLSISATLIKSVNSYFTQSFYCVAIDFLQIHLQRNISAVILKWWCVRHRHRLLWSGSNWLLCATKEQYYFMEGFSFLESFFRHVMAMWLFVFFVRLEKFSGPFKTISKHQQKR